MPRREVSLVEFQPKPKNDAFTVLLSISLVAMIAACLMLWFDLKSYGTLKPPDGAQPSTRLTPPADAPAPAPNPGDKPPM